MGLAIRNLPGLRRRSDSAMKKRFCAGILLLMAGCGQKAESPGQAEANSASTANASAVASQSSPVEFKTGSGVEMVLVPGGEFTMGSNQGNPDETPAHKVELTGFSIDKFEVTGEMFAKVQLPNPSHWNENPKKPVERVRWRDAKQYCNERSLLEGLKPCYNEKTADWECDYAANGYRLPTEAEWEYASRAGADGAFDCLLY